MEGTLLDFIQNYPYLYDKSRPDFKNNLKKENAWEAIAQRLNCPVESCKKMWQRLRDKYSRERKQNIGLSGSEGCNQSSWEFYDSMAFMNKHIRTRKRYSNLDLRSAPVDTLITIEGVVGPSVSHNGIGEARDPGVTFKQIVVPGEDESFRNELENICPLCESPIMDRNERKRQDSSDAQIGNALSALTDYIRNNNAGNANKSFGQFVSDTLGEMSNPDEVKYKKRKICELLFQDHP